MRLTRSYLEGGGAASAMVGAVIFALVSLSAMLANENWPGGVDEGSSPVVDVRPPSVAGASSASGSEIFSAATGLPADSPGVSAAEVGRQGGQATGRSSSGGAGAGSSSSGSGSGGSGSGGGGSGSAGEATPVAPEPAPPSQGASPGQGGAPPGQGGASPGKDGTKPAQGGTKPDGGSSPKPPSVTIAGKSGRIPPGQVQRATGTIGRAGIPSGQAKGRDETHPGKSDEKQLRPAAKATAAKGGRR